MTLTFERDVDSVKTCTSNIYI